MEIIIAGIAIVVVLCGIVQWLFSHLWGIMGVIAGYLLCIFVPFGFGLVSKAQCAPKGFGNDHHSNTVISCRNCMSIGANFITNIAICCDPVGTNYHPLNIPLTVQMTGGTVGQKRGWNIILL